jgi:phospholipid transport system substrate-binding protein
MTFCRRLDHQLRLERVRIALCIGFLLCLLIAIPARAANGPGSVGSAAIVEQLHARLLKVMKVARNLEIAERFKRLEPAVADAYSMAKMLHLTVGSEWSKARPDQRERLLNAFSDISVGTYARRFNGYSGEHFKTIAARPGPRGTILVETQIVRREKAPVLLTYVTLKVGKNWRIVDVLLDNAISELAVRRSEYRRIVQRDGIDGLIRALRKKADALIPR